MSSTCPAVPSIPPAPAVARPASRAASTVRSHAAIAALGAAFAGIVTNSRGDGPLQVALTMVVVFFGAVVLQFVLSLVFDLCMHLARLAVPVALVLLLGHLWHWRWADDVLHWIRTAGGHAVAAAGHAIAEWQTR